MAVPGLVTAPPPMMRVPPAPLLLSRRSGTTAAVALVLHINNYATWCQATAGATCAYARDTGEESDSYETYSASIAQQSGAAAAVLRAAAHCETSSFISVTALQSDGNRSNIFLSARLLFSIP